MEEKCNRLQQTPYTNSLNSESHISKARDTTGTENCLKSILLDNDGTDRAHADEDSMSAAIGPERTSEGVILESDEQADNRQRHQEPCESCHIESSKECDSRDEEKQNDTSGDPLPFSEERVMSGRVENTDGRPTKSRSHILGKFSTLFGKRGTSPTKYNHLSGRAESLYDVEGGSAGSRGAKDFEDVSSRSKRRYLMPSRSGSYGHGEQGSLEKERHKDGDLSTTVSKSAHVCCGMADGDQHQTGKREPTPELLGQSSVGADDSSIDGSRFSDTSEDGIDIDGETRDRLGTGSTDTDTDSACNGFGSTTKEVPGTENDYLKPMTEKVGQVPSLLVFCTQIRREFKWQRLWFNHYENVDFSVFEFGNRRGYLLWRCGCLAATIAIHVCTYMLSNGGLNPHPAPGLELCIHVWLGWLLLVQLTIEVAVLSVQYWLYPTCYLARIHSTPFFWKVVWCLNNAIGPNLCACCFMYAFVFIGGDSAPRTLPAMMHVALTSLCLLNSILGAAPVRLTHGLHPVFLTLTFLLYVNLMRPCSSYPYQVPIVSYREAGLGWNLAAQTRLAVRPCYLEPVMWHVSRTGCLVFTTLWVTMTFLSHCSLVFLCWCRRVVFRRRRERSAPVYGQSPVTHFFPEHCAEVSPHMIHMCEKDGFEAKNFVTGRESSPPYKTVGVVRERKSRRLARLKGAQDYDIGVI